MDRRQRKSREAIFEAFSDLLSCKSFYQITVGEIIERADIARATFYAHFETKDDLLKQLCGELFCHVFDSAVDSGRDHRHIFSCEAPDSVFLHLLRHLQKNDYHILDLLSGQNNDLFLKHFRTGLAGLIESRLDEMGIYGAEMLPRDYLVNHIAGTFIETVRWWVDHRLQESPETVAAYFTLAIRGK